ncbi:hypothetical protein JCM3775_003120 [Rhodotorula graminis]
MAHLSNDEFLTRLEQLFASRKDKGSVFLVQKRMTYEPEASTSTAAAPAAGDDVDMDARPDDADREYPLLLRATDGKSNKDAKTKLSTVVLPANLDTFLERYSSLLRTEFASALRPKRKRADLARARVVRQLTRQAKLRARKGGEGEGEPWMASSETIEAEAARRVKALEARARAAAAPAAGTGAGAGAGAGSKGKGGASAAAAAAGPGAFRVVLPKVVGPRRGNGVEHRRRAEKRRNKVVDKVKRRRDAKLAGAGSAP